MLENHGEKGEQEELLRLEEVAKTCSVSKRTVYRWVEDDALPIHRLPGSGKRGILRIKRSDLSRWLDTHCPAPAGAVKRDQTIVLNGRRFMGNRDSAIKELDSSSHPASSVVSRS